MTRLLLVLLAAASLGACFFSSSTHVRRAQPAVEAEPEAVEPDDAFASFGGTVVTLGEELKLHREPVGVKEVRALVVLGKTEWTIRIRGDGTEEKTGTANFIVQRGDDAANVRIESGDSGTALGVKIQVHESGEVYEESSMRWVQFARVTLHVE